MRTNTNVEILEPFLEKMWIMRENTKNGGSVFFIDGKPCDIPLEGSLGVLALGATGIQAWRKRREEAGYIIQTTNIIKQVPGANKEHADEQKKST